MEKKRWSQKVKIYLKDAVWVSVFFMLSAVAFSVYKTWDIDQTSARELTAVTLQGERFDLADAEKPVLLHYWASWCPVCTMEFGSIESISKDYTVVTVAMNSGRDVEVAQFMRENELDFPVIVDEDAKLARSWQVSGVPASFIIDEDKKVRFVEVGYTTELGLRLRLWLAGL